MVYVPDKKELKYSLCVLGIMFLTLFYFMLLVSNNAYLKYVISKNNDVRGILEGYYNWNMIVILGLWIGYGVAVVLYGWIFFCMYRTYKKAKMFFFPQVYEYITCVMVVVTIIFSFIVFACTKDAKELAQNFKAEYMEIENGALNKAEGSLEILQDGVSLRTLSQESKIGAFMSCRFGKNGIKLLVPDFFGERLKEGEKYIVYYTSHYKIVVDVE